MLLKDPKFWLRIFAVGFPPVAAVLAPILQASGNPVAVAVALALTSLASYHWGKAGWAPADAQAPTEAPAQPATQPAIPASVSLDATPPAM